MLLKSLGVVVGLTIGKLDSTWIYILHPIVIIIIGTLAKKIGVESIYNNTRPIIVFLVTTVITELIMRAKKKLRFKRT